MVMQIVQLARSVLVYPERHCGTIGFRLSKAEECAEGLLGDARGSYGRGILSCCALCDGPGGCDVQLPDSSLRYTS